MNNANTLVEIMRDYNKIMYKFISFMVEPRFDVSPDITDAMARGLRKVNIKEGKYK